MKRSLLIGCFVMACAAGMAQSVGDTSVLTFQDAVKIALMNSMTLNQQKNNLEVSQFAKTTSWASFGPSVSLNGEMRQVDGNSFDQQQGRAVNGIRDNVSASLDANIVLFNGFGKINTLRQSAQLLDAQAYFVNRTSQDVINMVSTQYLQVLLDMELLRIAKENFDIQSKQLQQIQAFVEAGSRATVDEYNQDALTKAAELRYVQAEIQLNNDKALLTQTLLIDPFDPFNAQKPSWDINAIVLDNTDPVALVEKAKLHRGDYLQAAKLEKAQKYGLYAARSNMSPTLIAFGSYGTAYNFQHNVPDSILARNASINRPFESQFRSDNVYKVYGLRLQIPLFNGLQNRYSTIQQKAVYRNAQLTAKNAEFQLKNDVLRTVRNFSGVRKAYQVAVDQLRAAELAFQYESERYNLGVTNLVEYSTANGRYIQALTDKAQAEYRLLFQKIQLEYSLGTLKIEDLQ